MSAPTLKATAEQVSAKARAWLKSEIERIQRAHGPAWPQHAAWVFEYLRAEMAEKVTKWRA